MKGRYSLITGADATSTTTSYSTLNGRKFSDYRYLMFFLYASKNNNTLIRDVKIIPSAMWITNRQLIIQSNHGGNLENVSGITFAYNTDTTIKAVTSGAGGLVGFEIQGCEVI